MMQTNGESPASADNDARGDRLGDVPASARSLRMFVTRAGAEAVVDETPQAHDLVRDALAIPRGQM